MTATLKDKTVLVVGRGGGIARAVTTAAREAGAEVITAGRNQEKLTEAYGDEPGITTEYVDRGREDRCRDVSCRDHQGAADVLARSLALELAPIRVNAVGRDRHRRLGCTR